MFWYSHTQLVWRTYLPIDNKLWKISTLTVLYAIFRFTSKTNHARTQLTGKNVMYSINIIRDRMCVCVCYVGTPRACTPSTASFSTTPSLSSVSGIRFPGPSGGSRGSNIQQTVCRVQTFLVATATAPVEVG